MWRVYRFAVWVCVVISAARADDTEIRLGAIRSTGSGVWLRIELPSFSTNRVDVYRCTNLVGGVWGCRATALDPGGEASVSWVDPVEAPAVSGFYRVGDHDLDTDGDTVPDAQEQLVHHTDPYRSDSDEDGLSDGEELRHGTDPLNRSSRSTVIYVDSDVGSDARDGWAATPGDRHGPKRSLRAANQTACNGDQIRISGIAPLIEPGLALGDITLDLCPVGLVTLHP